MNSSRIAFRRCAAVLAVVSAGAVELGFCPALQVVAGRTRRSASSASRRSRSSRLEEIFQSYLPTLRKQKDALDAAEAEFDRLVAKGDHTATLAQVDVVEAARAALNKSRALQLVHMRRVLTADQHAKLTAILHAGDRDRDRSDRNR